MYFYWEKWIVKKTTLFYLKILNYVGFFLLAVGGILSILRYLIPGMASIILGIIFIIPDYWVFYLNKKDKGNGWDKYWLSKFAGLIAMLILFVLGFIIVLIERFN